jgi:predicted TIM-barrel fold metal-dependent hydrolase
MLFGRTHDRNLDHPDFLPLFETAAHLGAPLYLHPQTPSPEVRRAYYDGFDDALNNLFATAGIGWHYENAVAVLRLILSGVFDKFPDLQLILGHWGELVLFYLERIDMMSEPAHLQRKISDYFKTNISVTPSGILSRRYFGWASEVLGVDRILFATDYPFGIERATDTRTFLDSLDLEENDRAAIAHGNWERLCARIRR